jgi:hypothetical protein
VQGRCTLQPSRPRSSRHTDGFDNPTPVSPWITSAMRSNVHASVVSPWASAPSSSACSIRSRALSGTLGGAAGRPPALQRRGSCGLPAGVPAAGTLPRDVQLPGDLGLGAALSKQFGGPFPTGLPLDPLAGAALSGLLLAAVGRHGAGCSHTPAPSPQSEKIK